MNGWRRTAGVAAVLLAGVASLPAAGDVAVKRGEKALLTRAYVPVSWRTGAYDTAWKQWKGVREKPAKYDEAFRDHYGLHAAPYPNRGYPMGLRLTRGLLGKGLTSDCMLCHGGSILGKSYVGLANASFDLQGLFEDLAAADGRKSPGFFRLSNVRGTSEAGAVTVFFFSLRKPDLTMRERRLDLDLRDDLCEDAPAWWLLKKKKTIYHTGSADARSVRALMQFMLTPVTMLSDLESAEPAFRDIQAYLRSLQPPRYPFPIDRQLARKGQQVFEKTCSRCHGTYGEKWTYPNRIVPLKEIGTDPTRYHGISKRFDQHFNRTWFAQEHKGWFGDDYRARASVGYQAPPLDGIWATAPYFHNGSVPTVYHVLNSKARPKVFTRSYRTGKEDYDTEKLGWKVKVLPRAADAKPSAFEQRKVYDTTKPGRGNGGHTFGDRLTEAERKAVIEYLKTL
jgi:hypothetical protein